MDTKLYNKLKHLFGEPIVIDGVYILPDFGYQFGIRETEKRFRFIYKGNTIKSYPNNESIIESVCDMLYGCTFIGSPRDEEMFTILYCGELTWHASNPFSTGTLFIEEGVYEHKNVYEDEYIDQPLTIADASKEIFKRLPYLPVLSFKYDGRVFLYINKKIK